MNVVDSSGWIEYFTDGKGAKHFVDPISAVEQLIVPSITLTEVFRFVLREAGEQQALTTAALMQQGTVTTLTDQLALAAASVGHRHKLPLADSVIYATALQHDATIWTQDADFEGLTNTRYFRKTK